MTKGPINQRTVDQNLNTQGETEKGFVMGQKLGSPPAITSSSASVSTDVNVNKLEKDLRANLSCEVRFDTGTKALYATDSSNYRHVPIGVVIPHTLKDVEKTVSICHKHGAPLVSRGAGTSLSGQTCNIAVAIDYSKYLRKIHSIDPAEKTAIVEPGVLHDDLDKKASPNGLMFGPDPSTHLYCTYGGMIGNDSCGMHSQYAGRTSQNVEELDVLTYDGHRMQLGKHNEQELDWIIKKGGRQGEIYAQLKELVDKYADLIRTRYPQIPRLVSGYRLDYLLPENGFDVAKAMVGSEGTCVNILKAKVRLVDTLPHRVMLIIGYPDVYIAGDNIPEITKFNPIALEGMDDILVENMKKKNLNTSSLHLLPQGKGWLIAEFGSKDPEDAYAQAANVMEHLQKSSHPPDVKLYKHKVQQDKIWEVRESGLGATAFVPGQRDAWPGFEDTAVPPEQVGPYLRDLTKLFKKFDYKGSLYPNNI